MPIIKTDRTIEFEIPPDWELEQTGLTSEGFYTFTVRSVRMPAIQLEIRASEQEFGTIALAGALEALTPEILKLEQTFSEE